MSKNIKNKQCRKNKPIPTFAKSLEQLNKIKDNTDKAIFNLVESFIPELCNQPEIFPLEDGGVQIEFEREDGAYLEFEFHANNEVKMFFTDFVEHEDNENIDCDINKINELIKKFYETK